MPLKIKITLSSKFSSVISPAFYHARYHNSVCKLCGRRVYIFKEMSPLLLSSHGSNLPKYNKQGINYHVITPNCLLQHNSNQNGVLLQVVFMMKTMVLLMRRILVKMMIMMRSTMVVMISKCFEPHQLSACFKIKALILLRLNL